MDNSLKVDVGGVSYHIATPERLQLVVALWLNGYLTSLKLRSLGTGKPSEFHRHVIGPLGVCPGEKEAIYGFKLPLPHGKPLKLRVNGAHGFDNRLEYWNDDPEFPGWTVFVTDACVQLLIPARFVELTRSEGE
jgi:hypothetical protein